MYSNSKISGCDVIWYQYLQWIDAFFKFEIIVPKYMLPWGFPSWTIVYNLDKNL